MAPSSKWNIILVGESGVGKTSMMFRYVKDKFSEAFVATVVVDYLFKEVKVEGDDVTVQIWDSAGQEIYKSIIPQYFRIADGCILVYDVTRITTFHKLSGWLNEFRLFNEKAPIIIVGNKCEDPDAKAVAKSVIKSYAEQEGMDFLECSAKTGEKVDQVFDLLLKKVWDSKNTEKKESGRNETKQTKCEYEEPELYKPSEKESFKITTIPSKVQIKPPKKTSCC